MTEDGFSFPLGTTDCSVVVSVHTGSQAHQASCAANNTSACWLPIGGVVTGVLKQLAASFCSILLP